MEGQEFLTEYRNISNKLKKRFLGRRPNVSEASEQFRQLGKRLEDSEEPQYAAFCHLATGKLSLSCHTSCHSCHASATAAPALPASPATSAGLYTTASQPPGAGSAGVTPRGRSVSSVT